MVNTRKIKARLTELGLTQDDLAAKLGLATCTVSQKLNNIRPLKLSEANEIAKILKIDDLDFKEYFFAEPVA
ncbi:MAG: helix-turn-helix transcriptional regulator [Clostridia bacterium]|nr:helix-turn-helix transcriptional regulator [Clostridia bacterium]